MSDTAAELLIKIKTLLDSQGVDAAKAKIDGLGGSLGKTNAAAEMGSKGFRTASNVIEKTGHAAGIASRLLNGTTEGFRGAASAAAMLFASFGRLSIIGNILFLIGSLVTILMQLKEKMGAAEKALAESSKKTKEEIEALNKSKLDKLHAEFEGLSAEIERSLGSLDRIQSRMDRERQATYSRKKAEIESSGLDEYTKQEKLVELDYQNEVDSAQAGISSSLRKAQKLEKPAYDAETQRLKATEAYDAAKGRADQLRAQYADDLDAGLLSPEQQMELEKANSKARDARKLKEEAEKTSYGFGEKLDDARKDIETDKKVAGERIATAQLKRDAQMAAVQKSRDEALDKWKAALAKEYETPKDVARNAANDLMESLHVLPATKRDNAGLPLSGAAQGQYDAERLQQATEAVQTAANTFFSGGDQDAALNRLIATLGKLHVNLMGKVDTEAKLKEVIDRLDGVVGRVGKVESVQRTAPGLGD